MDYSKKPVPRSQSSGTTRYQEEKRRIRSARSEQDRTKSLSQEEIRAIRRGAVGNESSPSRSSGTAAKNKTAAVRGKTIHEVGRQADGEKRRVERADSGTEKRSRSRRNGSSRNAADRYAQRSDRRPEQRKSDLRKPAQKVSPENFRGPAMTPPKKRRRPLSKPIKIIIVSCLLLLVCGTAYCWFLITGNLNADLNDLSLRSQYHISAEAATMAKSQKIVNIAVFGIDGRDDPDVIGDRTDTIMIASADFEHGGVKITSIMRDTFVWLEAEDDYDKINGAYVFGGAEGALQAINQNFDTAITDYVTVDFDCMVLMVNAVDGVEVTIDDEDVLEWTNEYLGDVNEKCGTSSPLLTSTGTQTLDGSQALAYCRVRYTGNGDFDRTLRQREVFKQVILKVLDLNPFAQYALLQDVLPYVETSLSTNEVMKYALNVMLMKEKDFSQMQLPASDYCDTGSYGGISYVFPVTLTDNIKAWYQFVYEKDYTPSSEAQEISSEISWIW